jgi:hypothetical protein
LNPAWHFRAVPYRARIRLPGEIQLTSAILTFIDGEGVPLLKLTANRIKNRFNVRAVNAKEGDQPRALPEYVAKGVFSIGTKLRHL